MNTEKRLAKLIADITKIPREELTGGVKLLNSGIISSLGMIDLIVGIEDEFSVSVLPEEFVEDNFRDIDSVCRFIDSKAGRVEA